MRNATNASVLASLFLVACVPATEAPQHSVQCVVAPVGYVVSQDKWHPHIMPCPKKKVSIPVPSDIGLSDASGIPGNPSNPGGGGPSHGPSPSPNPNTPSGPTAASSSAGTEGSYSSAAGPSSAAAAGASNGFSEASTSSNNMSASASAERGNVSTSVSGL